eukprot:7658369-Pyramimonas_sp.AAC.1
MRGALHSFARIVCHGPIKGVILCRTQNIGLNSMEERILDTTNQHAPSRLPGLAGKGPKTH